MAISVNSDILIGTPFIHFTGVREAMIVIPCVLNMSLLFSTFTDYLKEEWVRKMVLGSLNSFYCG